MLKSVVIVVDVSKMAYNVLNGTLNSTHLLIRSLTNVTHTLLHCALSLAAQRIVIGPVCDGRVFVGG